MLSRELPPGPVMPKRLAQVIFLLVTTLTMLGAGTPSTRFDKLGHQLMCPCGCAEILLECNHVGCPDSARMIDELHTQVGAHQPDNGVLGWFANKYGPTVLAAPIRGGFDRVAWIMPFAVLALGLLGITWLLRHWRDRHTQAAALATAGGSVPLAHTDPMRDRIPRETTFEP